MATQINPEYVEIGRMRLAYKGKRTTPFPGKLGTYLGGGNGRFDGPVLLGEVVWDLYENQSARLCDTHMIGTIESDDGAKIGFDILGVFRRDDANQDVWKLSSSIRFSAVDDLYVCFDGSAGLALGHFDAVSYTHEYAILGEPCAERRGQR